MPIFPIGRKAKDRKDLAAANQQGGTVTIRSRNKITNPVNPSQTLGRGSKVTITKRPEYSRDSDTVTPGKVNVTKTTRKEYTPGDMNEGRINDRRTTPELGKQLRENPAKTRTRIGAQDAGQTEYLHKGKREYSGRYRDVDSYETSKEPDKVTPGKIHVAMKKDVSVEPMSTAPRPEKSSGGIGVTIRRSAGSDKKGRPQNYLNVEMGRKKVFRIKDFTPGSKGRTGKSLRKKFP